MTKRVIGSVFFGIWLGCFTVAAAQLPPEIQAGVDFLDVLADDTKQGYQ